MECDDCEAEIKMEDDAVCVTTARGERFEFCSWDHMARWVREDAALMGLVAELINQ